MTTEVGFYHLTRTPLEEALPALLARTLKIGKRAVVRCADEGRVAWVDDILWSSPDYLWLPHGTAASGQPQWQPVWITSHNEAPNGASFLFVVDGAELESFAGFERVFDLFDGHDEQALEAARRRWSALKKTDFSLTYWKQEGKIWQRGG